VPEEEFNIFETRLCAEETAGLCAAEEAAEAAAELAAEEDGPETALDTAGETPAEDGGSGGPELGRSVQAGSRSVSKNTKNMNLYFLISFPLSPVFGLPIPLSRAR